MSSRVVSKVVMAFMAAFMFCAPGGAQTTFSTLSVNSVTMPFGDHGIGTSTAQQLAATNDGDLPFDLSISLSGDAPGDFSWSSSCLNKVPPKKSCQIIVVFSPAAIGKDKGEGEDRKATLTVTNDSGEHKDIELSGKAFQNLNVSPTTLEFESQVGTATSVARTVQLTNYTNSTVNNITVATTGDFTETHTGCSTPLTPGGSCGISVT